MVQNPTHAVVFWHPFNDAGGYGYLPLDKIKANNKPIVENLVSIRIFVDNMLATN